MYNVCNPDPNCYPTKMATGYGGNISTTVTGKTCVNWLDIPWYRIPAGLWKMDTWDMEEWMKGQVETAYAQKYEENYCRNNDMDEYGPWCVTDVERMTIEYCDIPSCRKFVYR